MGSVRVTLAVAMVLRAFLDDVNQPRYGYDLMRQLSFPSGKLYPILARLQKAGWLQREHEDIDPSIEGRPPRALYRLSPTGIQVARTELAALTEHLQLPTPGHARPRPEGGQA